ncbi:low choriolytic enzyme [Aplochiton taeniatus]
MNMISKHTCISFHMQTSEVGYLLFQRSQGCASFVGYKGVAQHVYISSFCGIGNICHEILHALGFYHEHTREDRDEQIEVVYNNIRKGEEKNFALQNGSTFNLPYDISSILHYGRCFFSVNGQPTIIPKKGSKEMGQRSHMTELDVQRVRRLYKCGAYMCLS